MLHHVPGSAKDYRRDAVRLEMPRDQTHGLVAYRSEGDQDGGIYMVLSAYT